MKRIHELIKFAENHFPHSKVSILEGGSINSMLEVVHEGKEYIVRGYPYEFKDKLGTETEILKKCESLKLQTPKIVSIIEENLEYKAPILILKKIPGETLNGILNKLSFEESFEILISVKELLRTVTSEIEIIDHIGYLHEDSFKGDLKEFIRSKAEAYQNIIKSDNLISNKLLKKSLSLIQNYTDNKKDLRPKFVYSDLSLKNIIVKDKKLAGVIDWEFVQGGIENMPYSNLILVSIDDKIIAPHILNFFKSFNNDELKEIYTLSIFRALELLSYMPSTSVYEPNEKASRIAKKEKELELIISKLQTL